MKKIDSDMEVQDMEIDDILFECDPNKISQYEAMYLKRLGKDEPSNDEKYKCYEDAVRKVYSLTTKRKRETKSEGSSIIVSKKRKKKRRKKKRRVTNSVQVRIEGNH